MEYELSVSAKNDITLFLLHFKSMAQKQFMLIPRGKNMLSISRRGLTIKDVKTAIYGLTFKNYIVGPVKDRDKKDCCLWIFGVEIDGIEFYVKLSDNFKGDVAKCISFHEPEIECKYPY
ncbi:MAG: hypothetical protein ABIA77_05885 [Candidatus Omnitrophota bacterium]